MDDDNVLIFLPCLFPSQSFSVKTKDSHVRKNLQLHVSYLLEPLSTSLRINVSLYEADTS